MILLLAIVIIVADLLWLPGPLVAALLCALAAVVLLVRMGRAPAATEHTILQYRPRTESNNIVQFKGRKGG